MDIGRITSVIDELYSRFLPSNELALVMKGGGIKGLAYVGAMEELEKTFQFTRFAGTSAGAITAILKSTGYTNQELRSILYEMDFATFYDANWLIALWNLLFKGGAFPGDAFKNWLASLISEKLGIAYEPQLRDLPYRATAFAATRDKEALTFDSYDTPSTPAAFAVRCSMSIPYVFIPPRHEGRRVFDGGLGNNYPVQLLLETNSNLNFIGLYLGSRTYKEPRRKHVFSDLFSIITEKMDREALRKYSYETIVIDTSPINVLSFKLNKKEKDFLLKCGQSAAISFLIKRNLTQEDIAYTNLVAEVETLRSELQSTIKRKKKLLKIITAIFIILIVGLFIR